MKILFLNNFSYLRGGSERVFFEEMDLLRSHGHSVAIFSRTNPNNVQSEYDRYFPPDMETEKPTISLKAFRIVKELIYSGEIKQGLKKVIDEFKPDMAHAHNVYGRVTTSALDVLAGKGIPVVMTLHDYKLVCPSYRFMYDDRICEDCKGGRFFMAVRNRCHKGSVAASAVYAFESYFNEWLKKYRKNVRFFISPSHFLKDKFVEFGWPKERIKYMSNFINVSEFSAEYAPGDYILFLGRLSKEKGVGTLVNAFMATEGLKMPLVIAGDGPSRTFLEEVASADKRIRFVGHLSGETLARTTQKAAVVVVPSEWYENAPMSILEAFSYGKPVIGATIGGIPEMIEHGVNGFLFNPGDANSLKRALEQFAALDAARIEAMGRAARGKVERYHSPDLHYQELIDVYREASLGKNGIQTVG